MGAAETPGVRLGGGGGIASTRCVLQGNAGAGALVTTSATNVVLTRNATFGNGTITNRFGGAPTGQLGIDLLARGRRSRSRARRRYVTRNDAGDADAGGNALVNFPVLESRRRRHGQLHA